MPYHGGTNLGAEALGPEIDFSAPGWLMGRLGETELGVST